MTLTHDGKLLLVAGYTATAVLSVAALEDGTRDPVPGVLSDSGAGEFEVVVSGDDRYAFVTDGSIGGLSVFDLATALHSGFIAPGVASAAVQGVTASHSTDVWGDPGQLLAEPSARSRADL